MVTPGEHGTRFLPAAVGAAAGIGALTVAGAFLPYASAWGFHFLAFLPSSYLASYVALFAALVLFTLRGNVDRVVAGASGFMTRHPAAFLICCIGGFAAFAYTFRVGAPLLGDGFYLVRNYSEAARGVAPLYYRNEPLATLAYSLFLKAFGISTFAQFLESFLRAELIFGAGTITSLFFTIRLLVRSSEDRFLSFGFVLAFPIMQLFFGYVEIYAAVVCAVSLFLLTAALYLTGRMRFRFLMLSFLLMSLTHYGTLLLAPALCYLAARESAQRGIREIAVGVGLLAAAVTALLAAVGFDITQFSSWVPHSHILPIAASGDPSEQYTSAFTLFSFSHLVDLANLFLLVAPCALILIAFAVFRNFRALLASSLHRFFLIALAPALGLMLVVKYDLGGARDWDVFTFVFYILSLYAAIVFSSSEAAGRRRVLFLLAGVTFLGSYLFFSVNSRPEASVARFTSLLDRRLMSQAGFYSASLYLAQYYHQMRNASEPTEIWKRYAAEFPADERGHQNLLTNAVKNGAISEEEIGLLFEQWAPVAPETSSVHALYSAYCMEAGSKRQAAGDLRGAERLFRRASDLSPASASAQNALGVVLMLEGRLDEALGRFHRASALDAGFSEPFWNIGKISIDRGDRELGLAQLRQAALLGHPQAASRLRELQQSPQHGRNSHSKRN